MAKWCCQRTDGQSPTTVPYKASQSDGRSEGCAQVRWEATGSLQQRGGAADVFLYKVTPSRTAGGTGRARGQVSSDADLDQGGSSEAESCAGVMYLEKGAGLLMECTWGPRGNRNR